jgi:long-chain acyl-CoA synthetase
MNGKDQYAHIVECDTFPKLLQRNAQLWPEEVALREKRLGIWNDISWSEYERQVRLLALGIHSLGVCRGEVVAIIGENRPQWLFGELATHALGGMSLGLYQDALPEELICLIHAAQPKVVIAENEEQVSKLLEIEKACTSIQHIIYCHQRGMRKYSNKMLISLEKLQEAGAQLEQKHPDLYREMVAKGNGGDVAILCPTAGTTGNSKLTMLQSGPLLSHSVAYLEADPKHPSDNYVSVLPLPWIMEQIYSVAQALVSRITVNFAEKVETMMSDLREVGPNFVFLSPRDWEAIAADVHSRLMDSAPFKQKMYQIGMKLAWKAVIVEGRQSKLAYWLLGRYLKDSLGFTHLRSAATGGAALGPDIFRFFRAIGVPLRQVYGQTELGGAYTIHGENDIDYESVGVPFSSAEVRIKNPDAEGAGEIVARTAGMFAGYYNDPLSAQKTSDGWLETGDWGYIKPENGHLVVIDRMRDMSKTAAGAVFAHQVIENRLKFSSFISEAVALGHGRPFVTALICIRYSYVAKWAEQENLSFTNYTNLAGLPEVLRLIRGEVERVNKGLDPALCIRRFVLLYKDLDPDDGELTRTRTLRRTVIREKYAKVIDGLYGGKEQIPIDTVIPFADGTKTRIRTDLQVMDMPEAQPVLQKAL